MGFGTSLQRSLVSHKQQSAGITKQTSNQNQALSLRALNLQSLQENSQRTSLRSGANIKGTAQNVKESRISSNERQRFRDERDSETKKQQNRSLNELSTGDSDETSSSESELNLGAKVKAANANSATSSSCLFPVNSRPSLGAQLDSDSDAETDWRPTRSLLEQVFVTDVTANFITVTVKESPTSVGFFSCS